MIINVFKDEKKKKRSFLTTNTLDIYMAHQMRRANNDFVGSVNTLSIISESCGDQKN